MKPKKAINHRRTFTARELLIGNLGPAGFGALVENLRALVPAEEWAAYEAKKSQRKAA